MPKTLSEREIKEHDAAYKEGWRLIDREIRSRGRPNLPKPDWLTRRRLRKAIELFERALQINETGWQSMWALGKIYQRLGEQNQALDWFLKAIELEPENPDVAREASICALDLGRTKEALDLTRDALNANPQDAGLLANRALALMIAGQVNEAKGVVEEAVRRDPKDPVSKNALRLVDDVASGKRPRPERIPVA